jgi:hypothetical protein
MNKTGRTLLWLCAVLWGGRTVAAVPADSPVINSISVVETNLDFVATFPPGVDHATLEMRPTLTDEWQSAVSLNVPAAGGTIEFTLPRPALATAFFRLNASMVVLSNSPASHPATTTTQLSAELQFVAVPPLAPDPANTNEVVFHFKGMIDGSDRIGNGSGEEGEAPEPQGDDPTQHGGHFHQQPTAIDVRMKINILTRIARRPKPSPPFQTINGQRDHANRHRNEKSAGNLQLLLPQGASAQYEADPIATGDSEQAATAKTFPGLVHEPTHGTDHDERTQIVGHIGDIEFWFFGNGWLGLQRLPEQIRLLTRYAGTGRRLAQFVL